MHELSLSQVKTCGIAAFQSLNVGVPVTVTPPFKQSMAATLCCGSPMINSGTDMCDGEENGSCVFTMTQNLCIRVPVVFGATPSMGSTFVQCGDATDIDVCTGCGGGNSQ